MFKLDVVVPTHNRCEDIRRFIDINSWFFLESGSNLFILDNASDSKTRDFLRSKSISEPYIKVITNDILCSAADNIIKAFSLNLTNRLWIMGDRYIIPIDVLNIADSIESNDFILLSPKETNPFFGYTKITKENVYKDQNALISASCLSTVIYPLGYKPTLQDLRSASLTTFPHTYIFIKNISMGCTARHYKDICVLNFPDSSTNWSYGDKWFETGVEGWLDLIDQLQLTGLKMDRRFYTCFVAKTSLGSFRGILKRRALGLISFRFYLEKRRLISKTFPLKSNLFFLVVGIIPMNILIYVFKKF